MLGYRLVTALCLATAVRAVVQPKPVMTQAVSCSARCLDTFSPHACHDVHATPCNTPPKVDAAVGARPLVLLARPKLPVPGEPAWNLLQPPGGRGGHVIEAQAPSPVPVCHVEGPTCTPEHAQARPPLAPKKTGMERFMPSKSNAVSAHLLPARQIHDVLHKLPVTQKLIRHHDGKQRIVLKWTDLDEKNRLGLGARGGGDPTVAELAGKFSRVVVEGDYAERVYARIIHGMLLPKVESREEQQAMEAALEQRRQNLRGYWKKHQENLRRDPVALARENARRREKYRAEGGKRWRRRYQAKVNGLEVLRKGSKRAQDPKS